MKRFVFSDGTEFDMLLNALIYAKLHPDLTVRDRDSDVTAKFKDILTNHGYGTGK